MTATHSGRRPVVAAMSLCWHAARWLFVLSALLQVIGAAALALQVLAIRHLLEAMLRGGQGLLGRSAGPLVLVIGALVISGLAVSIRGAIQPLLGERIGRYAINEVLGVALRADLTEFESPQLHDKMQHALVYAVSRPIQLASTVLAVIGTVGGALGLAITLAAASPWLVLVVVIGALPGYFAATRTNRLVYEFTRQQTESDRRRNVLQATIISREPAKEVRGYQLERTLAESWRRLTDQRITVLGAITRKRLVVAVAAAATGALITGAAALILVLGIDHGTISVATAGASALALLLLAGQLQGFAASASTFADGVRFVSDLLDFVSEPRRPAFAGSRAGTAPFSRLQARDVRFTYPAGTSALHGVDLSIARGEIVALVGRNGCGKTTLAKILCGLLPIDGGTVEWNGESVAELDIDDVRSAITPVFQDPTHLNVSINEYVAWGRTETSATPEAISAAVQRAELAAVVSGLPEGGQTRLGPEFLGGTELSGGQWQRLSLARALFRGGELIVLDEPASALDPLAEADLFGHARDLFPTQAVLLISHRFGSVRTADRIYVMDKGRIVEVGTHDELLDRSGLYAQMYESQRSSLLGRNETDRARPVRYDSQHRVRRPQPSYARQDSQHRRDT